MKIALHLAVLSALLASAAASAQRVELGPGTVARTAMSLRPGEYVWAPEIAPGGPMLLVVNLKAQRAVLYRNGIPIGASTVSTGRPGYETPVGVFTILQKHVEHYSSTYDNAPMPYMQRLTWRGVALHAGRLPGYPASHGCIRLPLEFAKLLYGVTRLGMTVVVTDQATTPSVAATPDLLLAGRAPQLASAGVEWRPDKSPSGPVSIIVSAADRRAIVLRNGIIIGSAPVTVEGSVAGSWAYSLRAVGKDGQQWIRLPLSAAAPSGAVPREEWQRFQAPEEFRRAVASIVGPGTTVIVTADSLSAPTSASTLVLENDDPAPRQ